MPGVRAVSEDKGELVSVSAAQTGGVDVTYAVVAHVRLSEVLTRRQVLTLQL